MLRQMSIARVNNAESEMIMIRPYNRMNLPTSRKAMRHLFCRKYRIRKDSSRKLSCRKHSPVVTAPDEAVVTVKD